MKNRLVALSLCIAMLMAAATLLGGCLGGATPDATVNPGSNAPQGDTPAAEAPVDEAPVELIWFMGDPGKVPADQKKVEEKLNELSVAAINATMKTVYYKDEQVKLALNANEKWDIAFTCEWYNNFAVQAIAGFFADITEPLQTVAADLYNTMPEVVWEGAKIDGKIMAIPVKKDYAAELFWRFDKALYVDELGLEIPASMSFADLEPYLKAAKDAYTAGVNAAVNAEYPISIHKGGLGTDNNIDMINRDALIGIPYSAVGTPDELTVKLTVETPDVYDRLVLIRNWYNEGYINRDAPTLDDAPKYSSVKFGQGFYGADAVWSGADGYTQVISKFNGPCLSTSSIRGAMNAINARSANIEKAVLYQQLVNTNQEYRDMLRYGLEGEHWNRNDQGLVVKTQTGRDGYGPWAFSQGSYSLCSVEAAEGLDVDPNMWQVIFDGYKDAVATKTIGFSFNVQNVEPQIAACNVIKEKYWSGLVTGSLDPATEVPKMIAELEAAGVRDVISECQSQLDAWMADR